MAISVTDPINLAIKRTRAILFEPFNATKWFVLGFCAWLANLGNSGGGASFRAPGNFGGGGTGAGGFPTGNGGTTNNPFDQISAWFQTNMILVIGLVIGFAIVVFVIGLVITWLMSRGQFMFIDGIVKDRGAVSEPWNEYKTEANSLFKFMFVWSMIGFLFGVVLLAVCGVLFYFDYQSHTFGAFSIIAIVILFLVGGAFGIVAMLVKFLLIDFVVPTMYKRRVSCIEAWHIVKAEFMPHKGSILLYGVMCIALSIGAAMVTMCLTYCMCCIPAIPYLGTVIFLPIFVFWKSYNLYFLEQFGPDWQFFAPPIFPEQAPVVADAPPPGWQNDAL